MLLRPTVLMGVVAFIAANASAAPPDCVSAVGTEFVREDGRAYRFAGMNLRGLVHYGGGDGALPYTNLGHIDENLAGAAAMGCRVIRVFAANRNITPAENVARLGYALDKADQYGLKLIIALTDFYPTPFHPAGDDGYYTLNPGGWTVLNHTWFAGGYQQRYLPWVTLAVSAYKDHPAVFSWQIGNELADQQSPDTHDAFMHAVAAHIKAIDPHHMVSTGMLSLAHIPGYTTARGVALYSDANLDFVTAHRYNADQWAIDFDVRDLVNKPLVVSEAGCDASDPAVGGDRVAFMTGRMNLFVDALGARGFMHWGYQAQAFDIGDGDNTFGIDRYAHPDYNALVALYAARAAQLNAYETLVGGLGLRGRNLAPETSDWEADTNYSASYDGTKAFDGQLSTKWTSTSTSGTHWLRVDLGQTRLLTGFRARLAGAGGEWTAFNLARYFIQTAPAPIGPWTTRADVDNTGQLSTLTHVLPEPLAAQHVRIYITDSGIDDYARLPEFEIWGDPPPLPDLDRDGDGDLRDVALWQGCFSGANNTHAAAFAGCDCAAANLTQDAGEPALGDVDLLDLLQATPCLAGPEVPLPPTCY